MKIKHLLIIMNRLINTLYNLCDIELKKSMSLLLDFLPDFFDKEKYMINIENGYLTLYIHYPEVIISNGTLKHLIKDIFVKLSFQKEGYIDMSGNRFTNTYVENEKNYDHSHLSTMRWDFNAKGEKTFRNFCLGVSNLAFSVKIIKHTKEDWRMFFFQLEEYLGWESLDGGPYNKIEYLYPSNSSSFNLNVTKEQLNLLIQSFFMDFIKEKFFNNYRYKYNLNSKVIELDINDNFYIQHLKKLVIDAHLNILGVFNTETAQFINFNTIPTTRLKTKTKPSNFIFKGKPFPYTLWDDNKERDFDESASFVVIHPSVLDYVTTRINQKIKKYYYEKTTLRT